MCFCFSHMFFDELCCFVWFMQLPCCLFLDQLPSLGGGGETPTLFGRLERASPSPHVRTETHAVSKTSCFLVFRILDDGHSPETQ
jgi:hypothetical protein